MSYVVCLYVCRMYVCMSYVCLYVVCRKIKSFFSLQLISKKINILIQNPSITNNIKLYRVVYTLKKNIKRMI